MEKTATQSFIEDAIAGGWDREQLKDYEVQLVGEDVRYSLPGEPAANWCHLADALLDPMAWKAVGTVREWEEPAMRRVDYEGGCVEVQAAGFMGRMVGFMHDLAADRSIEDALAAIVCDV